ncbi:hypothetical protein BDZ90DRAFT_228940 [Jaminaea rosea]|uniref:separase n=1 Tax=Jaminaea rosea TaxID=1569628 RepID=A0A316V001_9BASI|nr:hypothetical protein BDZ90DRAFT_228940 [Jaminaea rosea]PWN29891.1 hypothetical protein BDZ90DRAFT_228940 [Jaminaea rosea]
MPAKVASAAPPATRPSVRPSARAAKPSASASASASSSAATPSSRAPSSSSRISRQAKSATSTATTATSTSSVSASTSRVPMDRQAVVAAFKSSETATSRAIAELLHHLEVTSHQLDLELLQPVATVSVSSEPTLPTRESVQLAKEVVNASFAAIGQLCAANTAKTQTEPPSMNLLHLVDAFRISLRVVFIAKSQQTAASTSNRWQTHQVALTHLKRCVALGVVAGLRLEVAYIRAQMHHQSSRHHLPPDAEMLYYDRPQEVDKAHCTLVLELQSLLLNHLAEGNHNVSAGGINCLISAIAGEERGVAAWFALSPDSPAAQRLPFAVERCLSKVAQALPNSDEGSATAILQARKVGILWLLGANLQGADEATTTARRAQVVARIERMAVSHWKEGNARQAQGEKQAMWAEIDSALREIEGKAGEEWEGMKEWTKLKETWRWLAVKNGDVAAVSRLDGTQTLAASPAAPSASSSAAPSASSSSSSPAPQDPAALYAQAIQSCSSAVASLDIVRSDPNSTVASVTASLEAATRSLLSLLASSEASSARSIALSDRQTLLKLLDRLRRRCCASLSHWLTQSSPSPSSASPPLALFQAGLSAESQQLTTLVRAGGTHSEIAAGMTGNSAGYRTLGLSMYDAGKEEEALRFLDLGVAALTGLVEADGGQSTFSSLVAQQLALLEAALYHVGGRVYTARRYALAVRFIEGAAQAGEEALRLCLREAEEGEAGELREGDAREGDARGGKQEDLNARAHSLYKKWDYAAACHRMLARPKEALQALRRSLLALPASQWERLEVLAATKPVEEVFDSTEYATVARTLRTLFEVSVFELLAPTEGEEGIAAVLQSSKASQTARALCLEYLASSSWTQGRMHTEGAEQAVHSLLATLTDLCDSQASPLRRARALLHRFERAALAAGPGEDLALGKEIFTLLEASDLAQDAGLAPQLPILKCRYRLLAIFAFAAAHGEGEESVKRVEELTKLASESVRDLFEISACTAMEKRGSLPGGSAQPQGRTPPLRTTEAPKQVQAKASVRTRVGQKVGAASTTATRTTTAATRSRAAAKPAPTASSTASRGKPVQKPLQSSKFIASPPIAPPPVTPPRRTTLARKPVEGSAGLIPLLELTCDYLSAYGQTLLSVELLQYLRRLTSGGVDTETWQRATLALAKHQMSLGRTARAESLLSALEKGPTDLQCAVTLLRAQLAQGDEALSRYSEAVDLAASLDEEGEEAPRAGLSKVLSKVARYRRVCAAAEAFSHIAEQRGDGTRAIEGAFHAAQYAIRASSLLARVTTYQGDSTGQAQAEDAVAATTTLQSSPVKDPARAAAEAQEAGGAATLGTTTTSTKRAHRLLSVRIASTHCQVQRDLLISFHRLAHLYQLRGSARDAELFAGEAVDLATGLRLSLSTSQSLLLRAEVRLQLGKRKEGEEDVAQAIGLLSDVWLPEAATLACIQGDQLARRDETREEALRAYKTGQETVRALRRAYTEVESVLPSPSPSTRGIPTSTSSRSSLGGKTPRGSTAGTLTEGLLAELHCRLLRRQAWLLQVLGRHEESEETMSQADAMQPQPTSDDQLACGRLELDKALRGMKTDAVWNMVSDAVVALPSSNAVAVKSRARTVPASSTKAVLACLAKAEQTFQSVTQDVTQGCAAVSLRRAWKGLALSTMLHRTLSHDTPALEDMLKMLDSAAAVTLQREAEHAVWSKLEVGSKEAWLRWQQGAPGAAVKKTKRTQLVKGRKPARLSRAHTPSSDEEGVEAEEEEEEQKGEAPAWRAFWKEKQDGLAPELHLPANWTVISLSLSRERNSLVLSRRSASSPPMVLSLPFDRRRDEEDEEDEEATPFDLDAAQRELKAIVDASNALTSSARNVSVSQDMEQRKAWWTSRRELDTRMKVLCAAIEEQWLGPFKSLWGDAAPPSDAMGGLRASLDGIVQRMCFPHAAGKQRSAAAAGAAAKVQLDEAVYDLVSRVVPSATSDEELEDLLNFIMDIHQLNGVPVPVDEADMDMLAYDLRAALEEYRSASARESQRSQQVGNDRSGDGGGSGDAGAPHLFLVLDKDTAAIPWESLPSLRGRAICRVPSLSFLADRVEMARRLGASQGGDGAFHLSRSCRAYYLLNPSKDLTKSQERFEPYLRSKTGWRGVIGRAPAPNDFGDALSSYPLVLYFGHSGAEQYVRATKLRSMQRCAVTMLWGCSSAVLRDQGDFDRTGTPYNYMMAGSPCVVGQLFDATDKELDSVSEAVLVRCGLKEAEREDTGREQGKAISLAQAVASSRDSCRLPYLTGAAPVVYGVPVYFDRE